MTIVLYDLAARDGRRMSPFCWRTKLALAHKGLDFDAVATRFTEIPKICGGGQKTVPVLQDKDRTIGDSWRIAEYLEDAYPDRPSLFGGPAGKALSLFAQNWTAAVLHNGLFPLVVKDIHDHLEPVDQPYFRESREKHLGKSLEETQAGREGMLEAFRRSLLPLRLTLKAQPFLGGAAPLYADYIAFGAFQWVRGISPLQVLEPDDPVQAWVLRCRDLHGGLGRSSPGYD
jgi:glutathione S-transferase